MATWDTSLPQYADISGFGETPQVAKLETQMDTGPKHMRNLYTSVPKQYTIVITCTDTQVDTFEDFYSIECANGTLEFTWVHPRKHTEATMRFIGNYAVSYKAYDAYTVKFIVEILP